MTDTSKAAIAAVVERLREQAASLENDLVGVDGIQLVESDAMREAASLISALEAKLEKAAEALEPFAKRVFFGGVVTNWNDADDFRRARSTLSTLREAGNDQT